jgi:hypothetical protein
VKRYFVWLLPLAGLCACVRVQTDPINVHVDPIYAKVDVNVLVKVDKELDDFFATVDRKAKNLQTTAPTRPTAPITSDFSGGVQ